MPQKLSGIPWQPRSILALGILALGIAASSAAPAKLGDLDGDGQVTVLDLVLLIDHINGVTNLPPALLPSADISGDGILDQSDVDGLADLILGLPITARPVTLDPTSGSSDVGVMVRPKATFPRQIDTSTLNSNNFYASFAGKKLPATIVPASNGTFAWLFFSPQGMPNSCQITVTVDGSTITNLLGEQLDADGDGVPGGSISFNFSTVSVAPVPGTYLSSLIVDPGPDLIPRTADDVSLGPNGYNYLLPIAGVQVYILGLESNVAYTDTNGFFMLSNMPVGDVKIVLDGRTATHPPTNYYFPEMVMDANFQPGITNPIMSIIDTNGNVMRDTNGIPIPAKAVYLPRVLSNILQTVSTTNVTTITLNSNAGYNLSPTQQQYLTITVQPGSLVGMNGQPMPSGQVGVSVVPPSLVQDMLPAGLLQHTFDITVQAPGVATFSTPAQMTFPNVFNAPPGTKLCFLSFDHTTGRLVIDGTATVSADGLSVITDPGTGVTHPGWHGLAPPGTPTGDGPPPPPPPPPPPGCKNPPCCPFDATAPGGLQRANSMFLACGAGTAAGFLGGLLGGNSADNACGFLPPALRLACQQLTGHARDSFLRDVFKNGQTCHDVAQRCKEDAELNGGLPPNTVSAQSLFDAAYSVYATNLTAILTIQVAAYAIIDPLTNGVQLSDSDSNQLANLFANLSVITGGATATDFLVQNGLPLQDLAEAALKEQGLDAPTPHWYLLRNLDTGFDLRGQSDPLGHIATLFLSATNRYQLYRYFIGNAYIEESEFISSASGVMTQLPKGGRYILDSVDSDGDGLGDLAELVVGSDPRKWSTCGDGISDLARLRQGLSFDNCGTFPTAVIGNLPVAGEANDLVIAASQSPFPVLVPLGSATPSAAAFTQNAYVACGSRGLSIVNVSLFNRPVLSGQLDLPGNATAVAVDTTLNIAVVAANGGGLHFIGVSDPLNPRLSLTIATNASAVRIIGGVVYAAIGNAVQAYDLLTGDFLQSVQLGSAGITGLASEGFFLYAMDSASTLWVIDATGDAMVARGSLALASAGGQLFVGDSIAYVAAFNNLYGGFITVNVANPDNPVLLANSATTSSTASPGPRIVVNGSGLGLVAVAGGRGVSPGLQVYNVSNPTNTGAFVTSYQLPVSPNGLAIGGGIAFVADGTAGLQVINYRGLDTLGVPPNIVLSNSFTMMTPTNGVATEGNLVRVLAVTSDDVQVRNVEFYVNGLLVSSVQSFPFEYLFVTPAISATVTNFTLQARAFDTGGNATWTPLINVQLAPDLSPPRLRRSYPAVSNVVDTISATNIYAYFNKPINGATLNNATFTLISAGPDHRLGTADDFVVTNGIVTYLSTINAGALSFSAPLRQGLYRATISTNLTDASGNRLTNALSWTFWVLAGGANGDADNDDLSNAQEVALGTDPLNPDTDGDGWVDGVEVADGKDPLDPKSHPQLMIVARPPAEIVLPGLDETGLPGAGTLVAKPPVEIILPGADETGAPGAGTTVAGPPLEIILLGVDETGSPGAGTMVANPPLEIILPGVDETGGPGAGTTVAYPPVEVILPGADESGSPGSGTFVGMPPMEVILPGADESGAPGSGTYVGEPPVIVQYSTNTSAASLLNHKLPKAQTNSQPAKAASTRTGPLATSFKRIFQP
jgi:hypothetical protein